MLDRWEEFLLAPFQVGGGISKVLVLLFCLINGVVLFNAACHQADIGYDANAHLKYIQVLSRFKLPTPKDTYEFFSPPLAYLVPALLYSVGILPFAEVAKFAQVLNGLFSILLTFYLLKTCELIRPGNLSFKIMSLALLGMLPVYYKTFAFVRGEPLLATLTMLVTYKALTILLGDKRRLTDIVTLGISLGLAVLARQQGLAFLPVITIFAGLLMLKHRQRWTFPAKVVLVSFPVALLVGGWFYIYSRQKYGAEDRWRQPFAKPSFKNHPREFYLGLGSGRLFSDPIRPSFRNQVLPTFYSELWGDYECYFVVFGKDMRSGRFVSGFRLAEILSQGAKPAWLKTNRYDVRKYLGRVNLVSLFPSALFLSSLILALPYFCRFVGKAANNKAAVYSFLLLLIVMCLGGYLWFLISYPSFGGDTIKASYVLQIFPLMSILGAELLEKVKEKSARTHTIILILLGMVAAHNFPVFITRYIAW